jgi:hypothetical protein
MRNILDGLAIDAVGTVTLDDSELMKLESDFSAVLHAGKANGGCANVSCNGTTNGSCTNSVNCGGNTNSLACVNGGANCRDLKHHNY